LDNADEPNRRKICTPTHLDRDGRGSYKGEHCEGVLLGAKGPNRVLLDLKDVTLVDRMAVRFLGHVDAAGIALINCADYIRSWIAAEDS